jgi:hypothetical protein
MVVPQKPVASGSPTGRSAAYAALALTLIGLPLIAISESGCESGAAGNTGYLGEPGATGGVLGFSLAPLLAIAALILLGRAARRQEAARPSALPVVAAVAVFPLALANFLFWVVKGAFGCGFF